MSRNYPRIKTLKEPGEGGSFNNGVYLCRARNGKTCVEKGLKPEDIDMGDAQSEITIMMELKHRNIVGFVDYWMIPSPLSGSIYMEHCELGDLQDVITNFADSGYLLPEVFIWDMFKQLADAVAYLQTGVQSWRPGSRALPGWVGVVHRDIKPMNIFLSCTGAPGFRYRYPRLVLGDFGHNIQVDDPAYQTWDERVGTPVYAAPDGYGRSGDVWSIGATVYSLCRLAWGYQRTPQMSVFTGDWNQRPIQVGPRPAGSVYRPSLNRLLLSCQDDAEYRILITTLEEELLAEKIDRIRFVDIKRIAWPSWNGRMRNP